MNLFSQLTRLKAGKHADQDATLTNQRNQLCDSLHRGSAVTQSRRDAMHGRGPRVIQATHSRYVRQGPDGGADIRDDAIPARSFLADQDDGSMAGASWRRPLARTPAHQVRCARIWKALASGDP